MKLTGENRSTREKTCPSATLSTTNPTRTDMGTNPDLLVKGRRLTARPTDKMLKIFIKSSGLRENLYCVIVSIFCNLHNLKNFEAIFI
jgi:hypothetical protein